MALHEYSSDVDPDYPETPLMCILVKDNRVLVVLYQDDDHVGMQAPQVSGSLPEYIRKDSSIDGDTRITYFSIPQDSVRMIRVQSGGPPYADYEVPDHYDCMVELTDGGKLFVEGDFGEEPPEDWYYQHKVVFKK